MDLPPIVTGEGSNTQNTNNMEKFKPSPEHDYLQANIAFILRNAILRNRTANETQFVNNERMRELGLNPDEKCLEVYFEREIARNVFKNMSAKQSGKTRMDFNRLAKLPYYPFERGVSKFIEETKKP